MAVWVYRGDGFDAAAELWSLRRKTGKNPEKDAGFVNGLYELNRIADHGFLPCPSWRNISGNLWLFRDGGFRMLATVPGDGRGQTYDICLVVSQLMTSRMTIVGAQDDFFAEARNRVANGKPERWDDEF